MTVLSKQPEKGALPSVNLDRYSDEGLHALMDAVQSEIARRASVNARRRALLRRLESIAASEGLTLDEVRQYLRGDTRSAAPAEAVVDGVDEQQPALEVFEQSEVFSGSDSPFAVPFATGENLERERAFESLLQKELG